MADEKEEKKEEAQGEEDSPAVEGGAPKAASKMGTLVVIIIGFAVMIITPIVSFFVVKSITPPPIEEKPKAEKSDGEELVISFDQPVRINIRGTKGTRFLVVKPHLVVSEVALHERLMKSKAMLADKVSLAASRRTVNDLEGPEARDALKRDVMSEINNVVKDYMEGSIIDVYFSEFLMQ